MSKTTDMAIEHQEKEDAEFMAAYPCAPTAPMPVQQPLRESLPF